MFPCSLSCWDSSPTILLNWKSAFSSLQILSDFGRTLEFSRFPEKIHFMDVTKTIGGFHSLIFFFFSEILFAYFVCARGPIWVNINYLILRALKKYYAQGPYEALSNEIFDKLSQNLISNMKRVQPPTRLFVSFADKVG
jgi:hypothetical protein